MWNLRLSKVLSFLVLSKYKSLGLLVSKMTEFPKYSWMFLPCPCSQSDLAIKKKCGPNVLKCDSYKREVRKTAMGKECDTKKRTVFSRVTMKASQKQPVPDITQLRESPSGDLNGLPAFWSRIRLPGSSSATLYFGSSVGHKRPFKNKISRGLSLSLNE